jgi:hypothetical protein
MFPPMLCLSDLFSALTFAPPLFLCLLTGRRIRRRRDGESTRPTARPLQPRDGSCRRCPIPSEKPYSISNVPQPKMTKVAASPITFSMVSPEFRALLEWSECRTPPPSGAKASTAGSSGATLQAFPNERPEGDRSGSVAFYSESRASSTSRLEVATHNFMPVPYLHHLAERSRPADGGRATRAPGPLQRGVGRLWISRQKETVGEVLGTTDPPV